MALPPLPTTPVPGGLRVVVLTCSDLGLESAAALVRTPGVASVTVVRAPMPRPASFAKRIRLVYRRRGPAGLAALPLRKLAAILGLGARGAPPVPSPPDVRVVEVAGFRTPTALATLRELAPDLGIVDGTNVLREETFGIPRFGCVNLHCGLLPDYKGAPPGFWELRNGEREVGVTVHRVTAELDAGPILAQGRAALDPVPAGDVMAYLDAYWRGTLRPIGLRLLAEVAAAIAEGRAEGRPQGVATHPTYRLPDHRQIAELRRIVRARRAGARA